MRLLSAVWAVFVKEWRMFVRYPTWVFAVLVWPALFPAMYVFLGRALAGPGGEGLAAFGRLTGTTDYVGYVLFGTTFWMILNIALWSLGTHLRQEQLRGTLEPSWMSPTPRLALLAGAGAAQLLQALIWLVLTLTEVRLLYGFGLRGDRGLLALLTVLSLLPVTGLGMAFASLVVWTKEANAMVFLVRGVFMVFAGLTYPIDVMPGWMQAVAAGLPLTYSLRAMRAVALAGAGWDAVRADVLALAAFSAAFLALGVAAFRAVERMAHRTGSLGHY